MSKIKNSFVLVGIGNIIFCDDGLGVYVAVYLEKNYVKPANLTIVDGGTLGFTLMTYYQEYDYVCIVGTTSEGERAGEVSYFSKDELLDQSRYKQSANEVEVAQMLEICSILDEDMAEVDIVVMKPYDIITVKTSLSDIAKDNFLKLIEKTLEVLKNQGIALKPKKRTVTLDEIIKEYANPVISK